MSSQRPSKRPRTEDKDKGSNVQKLRRDKEDIPKFIRSKVVTVLVGKDKGEFLVHESLLLSGSVFFQKALNTEWKEGSDRVVTLPQAKPLVFEQYIGWLYTGRLFTMEHDEFKEETEKHVSESEGDNWVACYKLGDFLQDFNFKDFLIDIVIEKMIASKRFVSRIFGEIYSHTTTKSPNRLLPAEIALNCWSHQVFKTYMSINTPPLELFKDMVEIGSGTRDRVEGQSAQQFFAGVDTCKYHEHTLNSQPCYKTKMDFRSTL